MKLIWEMSINRIIEIGVKIIIQILEDYKFQALLEKTILLMFLIFPIKTQYIC